MADDRMKEDDRDRNMGGAGQKKDQGNLGQKTPGRDLHDDDDLSTGQRGAGQRGEQRHKEDDFGSGEQGMGGKNQGGQNRQNR